MKYKVPLLVAMALVLFQGKTCSYQQKEPAAEARQKIVKPEHEFELHQVRNGPLMTTALLDRKTGRVWIWTKITDAKKVGGPESAFVEEEVIPQPVPTVEFEDLPK